METFNSLLDQKKKLSDGTCENIFLKCPPNIYGVVMYICILCKVHSLPGEALLLTHVRGKKHQIRIQPTYVPDALKYRIAKSQFENGSFTVERDFNRLNLTNETNPSTCYLDFYTSKTSKPLIGLDYIIELINSKCKEPLYICILCDKKCDPRNIISQITSHNHRMKFLTNNFPTLMSTLNKNERFNIDMSYREEVLTKTAQAIEDKFGRMKPSVYRNQEYEQNKLAINLKISSDTHINEKDFPDILKVLENQEFCVPSTSREANISSISASFDEKSNQIMLEAYNFEKFKNLYWKNVKIIEDNYCEYHKYPERHPEYDAEWRSYWGKRYQEVVKQKIDPDSYDYIPEWIKFWKDNLHVLKKKDIKQKVKEIREKLDLSKDIVASFVKKIEKSVDVFKNSDEFSSKNGESSCKHRERSLTPHVSSSSSPKVYSNSPILYQKSQNSLKSEENSSLRSNKSSSKFEENSQKNHKTSRRSRPLSESVTSDTDYESDDERRRRYARDQEFKRRRTLSPNRKSSDDESSLINIIVVCRHLAAIDEEIGSILMPRVLDLLEKALKMERIEANSSENLLYDSKILDLLATIKEKLKGVINADLVKSSRVRSVKKAVKNIAKLLHEAKKFSPPKLSEEEQARLEIAKVVAETLIKEGKQNISTEELDNLIEEILNSQLAEKSIEENQVQEIESEASDHENSYSCLTDNELKVLLKNYSELDENEQNYLTNYLKKIEKNEPLKMRCLEKYIDIGDMNVD